MILPMSHASVTPLGWVHAPREQRMDRECIGATYTPSASVFIEISISLPLHFYVSTNDMRRHSGPMRQAHIYRERPDDSTPMATRGGSQSC